jgi:hypothetical protein
VAVFSFVQKQASPELTAFAHSGDAVCNAAYWKGEHEGDAVDRLAKERGYSGSESEAAWEYAQAESMQYQYRALLALGDAPDHAQLMRRWIETSKQRADLYAAHADALLNGTADERHRAWHGLSVVKYNADRLAGRLPFSTCGTPWTTEWVPRGGSVTYSMLQRFSATLTPEQAAWIEVGTDIYWTDNHHRAVLGDVTSLVRDGDWVVVKFRVEPDALEHMHSMRMAIYKSEDPALGNWLEIVPDDDASAPAAEPDVRLSG